MRDKIEAMIKKLELFLSALARTTHLHRKKWYDFLCVNALKLTDNVKCDIAKHLSELGSQLRRYFTETVNSNNWIRYPFNAQPPVHFPISEQESLIEIANSCSVKIAFNQKPLPDFWKGLHSEFLVLANQH